LAQAQPAPPAATNRVLPEVTVSATREARDPFDLPVAIDSVDAASLREGNPMVNLSEALVRVPGVVVQNRQNYAQDLQISSRGFGARAAFGVRGVRLITDGIPATMPDGQGQAASFNLPTASRIEVMRGPFSSLYGNASGGVIQLFTADAPAQPTVTGDVLGGSNGTWRAGLQYGGQHGAVNVLGDASRFSTDGYRQHSSAVRDTAQVRLRTDLGERGTLTFIANRLDQPDTLDPLGLTAGQVAQNRRQAVAAAFTFNTRKSTGQNQGGLTWDLPLGGGTRLQARAYVGDRQVVQYLAIPLAAQGSPTSAGGVVDLDRAYGGAGLRLSRDTQLGGQPLLLSVGVDYDRLSERRRGFLNNNGTAGALKRDQDDTVANTGLYAQAEWRPLPRVGVLAGVRHTRVAFESRDYFLAAGNPDDSGTVSYSRTTPALGATLRLTPLVNLYANVGRGFETPTFAELAYRPGGASGLNFALRPSDSLHREIGVKALTGHDGQVNVALFRIDTTDEIVVNSASGGRTDFRNASGTRREGLELGWRQNYAGGVHSTLALTVLDASFRDGFVSGTPPTTVRAGSRLPGVAASTLFADLGWRDAVSGFFAGLEVRYSAKVYVNDQNSESAGGYTTASLRAGFQQRGKGWRLSQFVRVGNLTDRDYIGSVIVADANGRFYEPAPGRTFSVGVSGELALR
jgi:iron complex outermembrane recepter protein